VLAFDAQYVRRGRIKTIVILAGLAAALAAGCAQDALVLPPPPADAAGVLAFPSAGSIERSRGRFHVRPAPATLSGELHFPSGSGPFPAVILAHGCNGNRNVGQAWGPVLREWGFATFVIDSFQRRGISEVCTGGQQLAPLQRVPDAYGALRLLAAHPRVDPRHIVLMGFSHGGALALLAATEWAKQTYAPAGQPSFRAFIAFYPNCNADFPERKRVSAPLRIHIGEADDWTPAKPCAELAASLKASGEDVAINVYPGAQHAFDQARGQIHLPRANNAADCFPQMPGILGPVAFGSVAGCLKKGATIAGNPAAAAEARRNLRAQLAELLK